MTQYKDDIQAAASLCAENGDSWNAINPESVARMRAQNRFQSGLDIAKYTANIMREDMAAYDADSSIRPATVVFSCMDWSGRGPNSLRSAATIQPDRYR